MISLELLVPGPSFEPEAGPIAFSVEAGGMSDRSPSLWNSLIETVEPRTVVHLYDRGFIGNERHRWLYGDIEEDRWRTFRFVEPLDASLFRLVAEAAAQSEGGVVWVLADAQFGPRPMTYAPKSLNQFVSHYRRHGLRINSAMPVHR